jgi:signal transduction histidine kinase
MYAPNHPMNTSPLGISKFTHWLKKSTQGTRIMQWISYIMIFLALVVFILGYPASESAPRFYGTVLILAVLLILNILWDQSHDLKPTDKRRNIYLWAFNLVTNGLTLVAIALTGRSEIVFLLFMQVSQFAFAFGVWPMGAVYGLIDLAIILAILKSYGLTDPNLASAGVQLFVGLVFVQVCILLMRKSFTETERAERLLQELQAAHMELKAAQEKEKDLAVAEERVRLARDIHDGLGHHLTVLSIQLQAAEKLVDRNPQAAAESIRLSRAEAAAALDEVRRSVAVMRQSPAEDRPLEEAISGLIHDFGERTDLETSFEQLGTPPELSPFTRQTLYRAVQEGLTNTRKHARGVKNIRVHLEYGSETVRLAVRDDGQTAESPAPAKAGYGLIGIRERVEQLGGRLRSGPDSGGGFTVEVSIPLDEAADG